MATEVGGKHPFDQASAESLLPGPVTGGPPLPSMRSEIRIVAALLVRPDYGDLATVARQSAVLDSICRQFVNGQCQGKGWLRFKFQIGAIDADPAAS